jgi:hypothetical protein
MHSVRRVLLTVVAAVVTALPARAQGALSGFLNVDNAFTAFLSTDPALTGATVASGNDWTVTNAFAGVPLLAGQDYWFQLRVRDEGVIAGFLATLTLSGDTHRFVNGGTTLLTNTSDWTAGTADWQVGPQALVSRGTNGVAPWGAFAQQSTSAQWVWTQDDCIDCTRYFSTRIVAVPEPATVALVATGLALLPFARRRRA